MVSAQSTRDDAGAGDTRGTESVTALVRSMRFEARGVISLELIPTGARSFPPFSAGAHVDVHLANGASRCYSIMNDEYDRTHYRIGVKRDELGTGGSRYIHDDLRVGEIVRVGSPRNNFPVDRSAIRTIAFAGGIGVTPFRSMLETLNRAKLPWTIYYSVGSRDRAAFVSEFEQLAAAGSGDVRLHVSGDPGAGRLEFDRIVSAAPAATHFYCCGPASMIESFRHACAGIAEAYVHCESFKAEREPDTRGGFFVTLARTGGRIEVPAGQSILEALAAFGVTVPSSCLQGICGTCETKVLAGTPDHRDVILSNEEKARNDTMMICCSGVLGEELILDV